MGDINNDGTDDICVGYSQLVTGTAYIVWGGSDIDDVELSDANVKIRSTQGSSRNIGSPIRGLGDVNYDGYPDIAIGESGSPPNDVYIFYGPFTGGDSTFDDIDADVRLAGDSNEDHSYSVATFTDDVTGDDVKDLLIGSPYNDLPFDQGNSSGSVYIIPGIGL